MKNNALNLNRNTIKIIAFLLLTTHLGFSQVTDGLSRESVPKVDYVPSTGEELYSMASIESKPEFPGGIQEFYQYIVSSVQTSESPEFAGGKVFASFVVEKDGALTDIKIIRDSAGFGMGQEVMRVLKKSPIWKPGMQNGKNVRVQYMLPVTFPVPEPDPELDKTAKKGKRKK